MELAEKMDAAWVQYQRLEQRMLHVFNFVPPVEEHNDVWSNELSEILILAGTGLDSAFEAGLFCEYLPDTNRVNTARNKVADKDQYPTIGDYRCIYEDFYALSQQPLFFLKTEFTAMGHTGVEPVFRKLVPFAAWKSKDKRVKPEWWDRYNALKHQGFSERHKASLVTIINSLAGYFLFLAVHLCSIPVLIRRGLIRSSLGGVLPSGLNWDLVENRKRDKNDRVGLFPVKDETLYVVETDLFGYGYPCGDRMYQFWLESPFRYVGPTREF